MNRQVLLLTAIFYSLLSVQAQYSDSAEYYAGFNATGTMNRTNSSSSYLFNNSLKLGAKKKMMSYTFLNKWLYGKQDERLTNNDYMSTFDVNIFKNIRRFYYWGLFNYTSAYSLKINYQGQAGLGVAYDVVNRKNLLFNLSDGFIYDYSDIYLADSLREKYGTLRNSFRIKFRWEIPPIFILQANGFYQPSVQYVNDYIIRSDLSLGLKLRKWLMINATVNYNTMSRTGAQNLFITYGVTLEKYY